MAGGVSVEKAAIQGGMGCCQISINKLESASSGLQRSYRQAGAGGWKDQKYVALGGIVDECCDALQKPIGELQECMRRLQDLMKAVDSYESINL